MRTATESSDPSRITPRAPSGKSLCEGGAHRVRPPASAGCGCVFTPANPETLSLPLLVVSWGCRIIAALILLQTLFFKFSGAEESVYIFTKVGLEPWGRYASGVVELLGAVMLLMPRTIWLGALLAACMMAGAITSHLTTLGIVVKEDGGLLFALALIVLACALVATYIHRRQIPLLGSASRHHE